MADNTVFAVFVDESNIEILVTCTGKIEAPTEQLLHGGDKYKMQPQKEIPSKSNVHTGEPRPVLIPFEWYGHLKKSAEIIFLQHFLSSFSTFSNF